VCFATVDSLGTALQKQMHQSGLSSPEIQTCLGVSNGEQPVWFRDALRAAIGAKANAKRAAEKVVLV